jgi:hypothetical protein
MSHITYNIYKCFSEIELATQNEAHSRQILYENNNEEKDGDEDANQEMYDEDEDENENEDGHQNENEFDIYSKKWQCGVLCWIGITFLSGICLIVLTANHFAIAMNKCDNYDASKSMYADHPELFLWEYCNFKVYPIYVMNNNNGHLPCNCRGFRMTEQDFEETFDELDICSDYRSDLKNDSLISLIQNIFWHWDMMEVLQMERSIARIDGLSFNLTNIKSKNLRAIKIRNFEIAQMDDNIGDIWSNLEYLEWNHVLSYNIEYMPESVRKLKRVKYFDVTLTPLQLLKPYLNQHSHHLVWF